jgi:hypothetical protein
MLQLPPPRSERTDERCRTRSSLHVTLADLAAAVIAGGSLDLGVAGELLGQCRGRLTAPANHSSRVP